jgi:NAD(P)-dependent dehydrogenase (short-subunit alcohol dehydrogenase family)
MSNIIFFGGTKFFGLLLAEKLLSAGHNLIMVSRIKELPGSLKGRVQHICEEISSTDRIKKFITRHCN